MSRNDPEATRTSRAAVASLLLALICCVGVIPAIVVGIAALAGISASQGRMTGKGFAIAGIVIGALQLVLIPPALVGAALLVPALPEALREPAYTPTSSAPDEVCLRHLNDLGLALRMYQEDGRALPFADRAGQDDVEAAGRALAALLESGFLGAGDEPLLRCPADPTDGSYGLVVSSGRLASSFRGLPRAIDAEDPVDIPLLWCENHGDFVCVLRGDLFAEPWPIDVWESRRPDGQ